MTVNNIDVLPAVADLCENQLYLDELRYARHIII